MGLRIEFGPEVKSRLREEAARRGKAEEELAAELIGDALPHVAEPDFEDDATFIIRLTERLSQSVPEEELIG
jgi:hypothetical protein